MKILFVTYNCKPGKRDAYLKAIKDNKIDDLCKTEIGNLRYHYSFDTENQNVLFLSEIWQDDITLATHGQSEHYKILQELKAEFVETTSIEKFDAEKIQ